MKQLKKLCFVVLATVSAGSSAGIPGDCDGWLDMLNRCEANPSGYYYGMTCAQIYYTWRDCRDNENPWGRVVGKENN